MMQKLIGKTVIFFFTLLEVNLAKSAEYAFEKNVQLNGNYRKSSYAGSDTEYAEYNLHPNFRLSSNGGASSAEINVGAHFRRFDKDQFDSNDYDGQFKLEKRFERFSSALFVASRRGSTFVDSESGADSQFNLSRTRKSQVNSVNVSSSFQMTVRNVVDLSFGGVLRSYNTSDQVDSESLSVNLGYRFQFSERVSLRLQVTGQQYEAEDFAFDLNTGGLESAVLAGLNFVDANVSSIDVTSVFGSAIAIASVGCIESEFNTLFNFDEQFPSLVGAMSSGETAPCYSGVTIDNTQRIYGGKVGFTYHPSENLDMDISIGQTVVDTELRRSFNITSNANIVFDNESELIEYRYRLNYRRERVVYGFNASRETRGSGTGSVQLKDLYSFTIQYTFDARTSTNLNFDWFSEEAFGAGFESFNRERYSASLGYSYRLSEFWQVSGGYTYYLDKHELGDDTERQRIMLTIRWSPTATKWSR